MIIFLGDDDGYKDIIKSSKKDKDIVVSCQYRYRVPESLIKSHTCVNIHYGILPFYAGCNPIYWQIMKGDKAGVTLHYMDKNLDTGDIIAIYEFPIGDMTADEVYAVLKEKGVSLLKKYYPLILNGKAPRIPQDLQFRNYYKAEDVNFSFAKQCTPDQFNKIRATHFKGKQLPIVQLGGRQYEISLCNSSL